MNDLIVAKFGGSSLADAAQIKKVIEIVNADKRRRVIVVSAPGKRHKSDTKITDLLYQYHSLRDTEILEQIFERFNQIAINLEPNEYRRITFGLEYALLKTSQWQNHNKDWVVSRGENMTARVLAQALGYECVGAEYAISFDAEGNFDSVKTESKCQTLHTLLPQVKGIVVPGFYGSMPDGSMKVFSRGGSDLTGSILTAYLNASLYENWTDVPGVLMADPKVVECPQKIEALTYRELRELSYMGAQVLHEEAVFPIRKKGIPILIRNTNEPGESGTFVVPDHSPPPRVGGSILGIAGRKDFSVIRLEKALMNQEQGFLRRAASVFEENRINIDHVPGGIDTLTLVVPSCELKDKFYKIFLELESSCQPDEVIVSHGMALIAIVGEAMTYTPGVLARISKALAEKKINIRIVDQGSSEITIILGIWEEDYEDAIKAIYLEFMRHTRWKQIFKKIGSFFKAALS